MIQHVIEIVQVTTRAGASVDANHRLVAAASISLIGARFLFSIIVLTSLRIDIEGPIRTVPARL